MALTPEQTQELNRAIDLRRAVLLAEIRQDLARVRGDNLVEIAGEAPDPGDESVAALIADLDHAEASRDISELRGLESARSRIAAGSYGTCIDCGQDIAFARLRANLAAERCIDCQARYERTYLQPSGSKL